MILNTIAVFCCFSIFSTAATFFNWIPDAEIASNAFMVENFPEARHQGHGSRYRLHAKQIDDEQAVTGDRYLPFYELMDDSPLTSVLALKFQLFGEKLCQLYVEQAGEISIAGYQGINFQKTTDTIQIQILPSQLDQNLKSGAKILLYIPSHTTVLLRDGMREISRPFIVKEEVPFMSLFSRDIDEASYGVEDKEPQFGIYPKAEILSVQDSKYALPGVYYARSSNDLVVFKSSSSNTATPLPIGPYYLTLFETTKGFGSLVQDLRLSFQPQHPCDLEVYTHIPKKPIALTQKSKLNTLHIMKHIFDQSLPRGSKVLLYVPATCGKVMITQVTQKFVNLPPKLYNILLAR